MSVFFLLVLISAFAVPFVTGWYFSRKKNENCDQDELIGGWYNGADDGSGLNAIWGYGIEFKTGGKAIYHNWGSHTDEDEKEQELLWERIDKSRFRICFKSDEQWEEIEYTISDFKGAYNGRYKKIVKKGTEEFFASPEPLYKS